MIALAAPEVRAGGDEDTGAHCGEGHRRTIWRRESEDRLGEGILLHVVGVELVDAEP